MIGVFLEGSVIVPLSPLDGSQQMNGDGGDGQQTRQPKKTKHVRLLLDARTELTNEELEVSRVPLYKSRLLD